MSLSPNLQKINDRAFAIAGELRHATVTAEHLLRALTDDGAVVSAMQAFQIDAGQLQNRLDCHLGPQLEYSPYPQKPAQSFDLIFVETIRREKFLERNASGVDLLATFLLMKRSTRFLSAQNVRYEHVLKIIYPDFQNHPGIFKPLGMTGMPNKRKILKGIESEILDDVRRRLAQPEYIAKLKSFHAALDGC